MIYDDPRFLNNKPETETKQSSIWHLKNCSARYISQYFLSYLAFNDKEAVLNN